MLLFVPKIENVLFTNHSHTYREYLQPNELVPIAIDTILISGDDHFWLVKRKDVNKFATMGGFVEVGETSVDAVHRELMEEMHIKVDDSAISLFGMYDDPMRDARRHTASAVYVVRVPDGAKPYAGDDAAEVVRVAHKDIGSMEFFADHKNILVDYISQKGEEAVVGQLPTIRRSLCTSSALGLGQKVNI